MASEKNILGIDIGANKTALAVYSREKNKVIFSQHEDYPENTKGNFDKWVGWVNEYTEFIFTKISPTIEEVGIGVAGVVENGKMLRSPNLPILDNENLGGIFKMLSGKEVRIDNDVSCFLRAESRLGAVKGINNVVGITLGTGVGGALIIDGKMIAGVHNSAGEVGHMVLDDDKTFEDLVSSKAFKDFKKSPRTLEEEAREGDKDAKEIYANIGRHLGTALGNIVNIVDPEAIVLGGGISHANDLILPAAIERMRNLVINPKAKDIKIFSSTFKRHSVALGAALLFVEE